MHALGLAGARRGRWRGGGDLRQGGAGQRDELSRDLGGPRPRGRRAAQVGAGAQTLGHARLLAEEIVADLQAALGCELARLARGEQADGSVRTVVHGALGDAEQCSHFGVALVLAQQQRQRCALVGWELVHSAHGL